MAVNVDRGCLIRHTPEGIGVFMYHDLPGVFFNEHEKEVGIELARNAGYNVDPLIKERKKRERIRVATDTIEAEYREHSVNELVAERGGYKVVHIGMDRHNILDEDGLLVNSGRPLTHQEAMKTLDALVPEASAEA